MKKIFFLTLSSIFGMLVSCSSKVDNNETLNYTLISPIGAPTLPLYNEFLIESSSNLQTVSNPKPAIPAAFKQGTHDFIVFDSIAATKQFQNEDSLYEFEMMLTSGSFHLLSFDNKGELNESSTIYSFQKDQSVDLLFKSIYKLNDYENITYFDNISVLSSTLLTMNEEFKIGDSKIDYAVVSEPQLTNILANFQNKGLDLNKIKTLNLTTLFKEKYKTEWKFSYIPQAALYVKKDFKNNNKELYKQIIHRIESNIDNTINNVDEVVRLLNEKYSIEEQSSIFGFNSTLLAKVQENGKNGFGIVSSKINSEVNTEKIREYLNIIE